jgi:hypothetical protein
MPNYRCYLKNDKGRIAGVEEIEAACDEQAKGQCLACLEARSDFSGVELWERDRLVHRHPTP